VGLNWAEQSIEIAAPVQACFDAVVDFETYPEWQNAVLDAEILDRHRDGLGRRVRLVVDAKFRKVDYVLHYRYRAPHELSWEFVEGNGVSDIEGDYRFEERDDLTLATYRLGVDAGIPIPGPIARKLNSEVLRRSVRDLKAEVERRSGS
jgi:uncharacterized membrane protein